MNVAKLLPFVLLISACSGGGNAPLQENPNLSLGSGDDRSLTLNGPPPQTDDVQRFRLSLWENLAPENRCGECHGAGGQSPTFARNDDINAAYDEVNPLVDLNQPSRSRLVSKVGGGHNCWLASNQACADILETWISNWAGESLGSSNAIELTAPVEKAPGASKTFPEMAGNFATTVHPLLVTYCAACHVDTAATPQSPFFAVTDVESAYAAARSKIELSDPASSRLVVRLGSEFHNCWSDCAVNAAEMLDQVQTFVDSIPETEIAENLVTSRALTLTDGVVASGGGRNDANVVALYQFKTLAGTTAFDTSGVDPALNLTFSGDVTWVGGWGIRIGDGGRAQGSTSNSRKLHDLITATGEYAIEVWAAPANVTQEEARIVSYSGGNDARNFTLGQTLYNYDFLARASTTGGNGDPALSTPDALEVLQATLQHVVVTYDPANGRQIYVNGQRVDVMDTAGGTLGDWDDTFAFVLGNEVSGDRLWRGVLRLVAVHNRALTPVQIRENFDAGVGEQFYLLFGVSHLVDVPAAYIVFEVSQFDSYSYLFGQPTFVSLDPEAAPAGIPVRGMRVGINGREPVVGQAYQKLDTEIGPGYTNESGQALSPIGTIFGIEKGPESDEFFLTFEQLGDNYDVRLEPVPDPLPMPADGPPMPDIGIKVFDEINATMSSITGVPMSNAAVRETFQIVRQQLPSVVDIEGFLSSQQMGITQLAIEYCNALVEDPVLRAARFPAFDFDADTQAALDPAGRDALLVPLLDHLLGDAVLSQPNRQLAQGELDSLITRLASTPGNASRTQTIAKAACAAGIGSAVTLIQ
ncbi:MAG: LamG domain-containing protein [Pseudomonadota bacterium]